MSTTNRTAMRMALNIVLAVVVAVAGLFALRGFASTAQASPTAPSSGIAERAKGIERYNVTDIRALPTRHDI